MILQSLTGYYEQLAEKGVVSRPGWCSAKVSFALNLRSDGSIAGIIPLKETEKRGKKTVEVPQKLIIPELTARSSGIKANFLCDNSKYMLGVDANGAGKRNLECFMAAKKKHLEILEGLSGGRASAVRAFFEVWDPEKARENQEINEKWEELAAGGNIVFYVDEKYVHEDPDVKHRWEQIYMEEEEGEEGICLVTGKKTRIARIHNPIKGVPGAQSSGAALVSFNAPAFESFEKTQSNNAPVGNYAVFAYTTALNYLLSQKKYVKQIGDTTVVYWAEDAKPVCQDLFLAASEPTIDNQELVKGVFEDLEKGRMVEVSEVEENINLEQKFYILGLSPNAARLSVRFFYTDSLGAILRHIKEHYDRMEIVRRATDGMEYLGIWRMLQETINQKMKDKKPHAGMAGRTFEAVLSGGRYPESLYSAVLSRIRAEQDDKDAHSYKITRGRAAIIKAYLLRNRQELNMKGEDFVELNEECRDIAYVLGREFSVLEAIQEEASNAINATIKDRYFNSACATPALIFPVLFKLKNSHIRKLPEGRKYYYERELTRLQGMIPSDGVPKMLSLEQQGQFILGYYHQQQKRFEKKEEK